MYFTHHKVEATQVLNWLLCILSEKLLINPNGFITRSGIKRATMGVWNKNKATLTKPNELNNEEATEGIFGGTVLTALDLEQDPQPVLNNKSGKLLWVISSESLSSVTRQGWLNSNNCK